MKVSIKSISTFILILFHVVGLVLFFNDPNSSELSYLTILICGVVLMFNEKTSKSFIAYIVILLGGYFIEVIGVNTELLFGNYSYGSSLGFKLLNVPPLIGLNWLILVISGASIAKWVIGRQNIWIQAFLVAILCTGIDIIIEPVAIQYNFWNWEGDIVPLYNYACWFIFTLIFGYLYLRTKRPINFIAIQIFGIWIVFFSILNLFS
jgi:uncharacterized membrane protein